MSSLVFAVDPGNANVGWAVVEKGTRVIHELGKISTKKDPEVEKGTDYLRRAYRVNEELMSVFSQFHRQSAGKIVIVAESLLLFGTSQSIVSNALPHGSLSMLAASFGVELSTVSASRWMRAILGKKSRALKRVVVEPPPSRAKVPRRSLGIRLVEARAAATVEKPKKGRGKVDHSAMYKAILEFIEARGLHDARESLATLGPVTNSNHTLDAVGIGIYRASSLVTQIIATGTERV